MAFDMGTWDPSAIDYASAWPAISAGSVVGTANAPLPSEQGVNWGGLFSQGLTKWMDVEVWKATGGAGVPQWNAKPQPSPGAVATASAGLTQHLPLLLGLGLVAFLMLRKG